MPGIHVENLASTKPSPSIYTPSHKVQYIIIKLAWWNMSQKDSLMSHSVEHLRWFYFNVVIKMNEIELINQSTKKKSAMHQCVT